MDVSEENAKRNFIRLERGSYYFAIVRVTFKFKARKMHIIHALQASVYRIFIFLRFAEFFVGLPYPLILNFNFTYSVKREKIHEIPSLPFFCKNKIYKKNFNKFFFLKRN